MKWMTLLLTLIFVFSAYAKVKINDVEIVNVGDNSSKMVVGLLGKMEAKPEILVKDSILQVVIPKSVVWPKIEKKVTVGSASDDTTLMAYQFDKDSVRVRALLPFSLVGKEKMISMEIKDGKVELTFPKNGNAPSKEVSSTVDSLDENYLNKLMEEKDEKVPSNSLEQVAKKETDKEKKNVTNDEVKLKSSSIQKENGSNFSISSYVGKFIGFLAFVLILFYGAIALMKKGVLKKTKLAIFQNMKSVEVLNTTYLGPKKNLVLVKAHNQVFLIGTSEQGVHFLSEIKDVTGLIKNGEKDELGENFDMNLETAQKAPKEMKLKEVHSSNEEMKKLDTFLADAPVKEVKDQVKFSDQIKNKIKGLRPLQ